MKKTSPYGLAATLLVAVLPSTSYAALSLVSFAETSRVNPGGTKAIDLTTDALDWFRHASSTTDIKKTGTSILSKTHVPGTQGNYPAGYFVFNWTDGTSAATGSDTTNMTQYSTNADYYWEITATGLVGGSYQMDLYAVITDGTPYSLEIYEGGVFHSRMTINGDTVNDGNFVDYINSTVKFTTDGTSPIQFRFARDTANGSVGTTPADENTLAIGAWKLTSIPEPSNAALLGLGVGLLAIQRRRRS